MTFFIRTLTLILLLALIVPRAAYPALAEEATSSPDTVPQNTLVSEASSAPIGTDISNSAGAAGTTSVQSTSDSSAAATSMETNAAVTSISNSAEASSTERGTDTHATSTGIGGGGTLPATHDLSTTSPPVLVVEGTTTPLDSIATSSTASVGTSTQTTPSEATTTAVDTASSTAIITGDATAGANIVNVAAANFVNSAGEVVLGNYFGSSTGIDLRTATSAFSTGGLCLLFACTGSDGALIHLTGTSSLENLLALDASTGGNVVAASSSIPNASILTGNAFVGLNLVNLANLNVIDSAYLIAALNFFKGLNGDLVFPGLAGFFSALAGASSPANVALNGTATVDNQIGFDTATGGNATDATSSSIATGNAGSLGNVLNQLNSNLIGGANLAILLRITGTWDGQIYGAPDGLSVVHGGDGSIYITQQGNGSIPAANASLAASSSALITNHATLGAFTGDNGIFGANAARIRTGNALAAANVLTFANQNIIGRNWLTAVVNIFGDWNGNLAFGRPDLWVGERVEAPADIQNGSALVFHFTIANKGDAPASAATFTASLDSAHLAASDPLSASLGTLAPGATTEVIVHAVLHDATPGSSIDTSGSARAVEPDTNLADNSDHIAVLVGGGGGGGGGSGQPLAVAAFVYIPRAHAASAGITVTRRTAHEVAQANGAVHEELTVRNPSDATSSPYDLHDLVKDAQGTVVEDQAWPLGTLAPHEEVNVSYDVAFGNDAPSGTYLLSSVLASDVAGDTEFKNNGSVLLMAAPVALVPHLAHPGRVAGVATSSNPTILRSAASTTTVPTHPTQNPLLAAVLNAHIPWTYALGFAGSAALLTLFLWAIVRMRGRHFS